MAKFLLLIYSEPGKGPAIDSPEGEAQMARWMSYTEELAQTGAMVSGDALQPVQTATSVRVREGRDLITDGPFAETKEHLGGYYLIDVDDLDAAIAWARKMPNIEYATVEIRPNMEFDHP